MKLDPAQEFEGRLAGLILVTASAASLAVAFSARGALDTLADSPLKVGAFTLLAVVLQLFSIEVHGSGRVGVSAIGILAAAFALGTSAGVAIAVLALIPNFVRRRPLFHRAAFDASQFVLATLAASGGYSLVENGSEWSSFAGAVVGGTAWVVVNNGLLCTAMGIAEGRSASDVWHERFGWARYHYLAFGPLAYAASKGYEAIGLAGLLAFSLPPGLLLLSFRQYAQRTKQALAEAQAANDALAKANARLESRNDDLALLVRFAGGLAGRTANGDDLVRYAEGTLSEVAGTRVRIHRDEDAAGVPVATTDRRLGAIEVAGGGSERWRALEAAVVPQLATALESATMVEEVRRTHLATIAALSRSMEAKDGYTGGHTERVSRIAVAVGRRVGYFGADLDAIEVGALLHDIGKIGIPESILHKPGPLNDAEWEVMRRHPITSEYILSGIELSPIVLQVARSSHERIDGKGYPDGLAGDEIPLPARIVLVADAYDALTSDRPYRRACPPLAALAELRRHAGTQFCPVVVRALEEVFQEQPALFDAAVASLRAAG